MKYTDIKIGKFYYIKAENRTLTLLVQVVGKVDADKTIVINHGNYKFYNISPADVLAIKYRWWKRFVPFKKRFFKNENWN